jgi:hypothetical protein
MDRSASSVGASIRSAIASTTAFDVWAFVLPAASFVQMTIGGKLILSEILALALLPWLLRSRDRLRPPMWLIALVGAWFASQVVTDILVGSALTDWTRGWAAIAFTLVDLLAILVLAGTPRRARIFALGLAVGGVLEYVFAPTTFILSDPWKFTFAGAIGYVLAASLSGAWAARRPWVPIAFFTVFGLVNAFDNFRSMSGVALMTAAFLLLSLLLRRRSWTARPTRTRAILGVGLYGVSALAIYVGLSTAAATDLLGDKAKAKFDAQAGVVVPSGLPPAGSSIGPNGSILAGASLAPGASSAPVNPLGVLTGGRAEFLASTQAIRDSPILGHGSWARGPKYVEIQRQKLIEMGVLGGNLPTDPTLIPTHSYLLGSWVWAGLAGGLFWVGVAGLALWLVASLYGVRLELSPLAAFVVSLLLWSIAFSPYSNTERLYAMFAIVVCLLSLRWIKPRLEPVAQTVAAEAG